MSGTMLKKVLCVTGLLFMSFPAWSAVPSNLLPTDSISSQMSLTFDFDSSLVEKNIFIARGPGVGAGVGAGGGAGTGVGPGAGAAAGVAGNASAQGAATSAAATSAETTGLEKGTAVVGTTPAADSAATGLNTAQENSAANDDEESPYGEY